MTNQVLWIQDWGKIALLCTGKKNGGGRARGDLNGAWGGSIVCHTPGVQAPGARGDSSGVGFAGSVKHPKAKSDSGSMIVGS